MAGTGGLKTGWWIHKLMADLDVDQAVEFVPIETSSIDWDATPDEFEEIPLDTDERIKKEFQRAKEDPSVPFVGRNHDLYIEGATRNPGTGRLLLERHDRRVKRSVESKLRSALSSQDDSASIWLVGTGSGGTAAGMLPLLAAMVRQAANGVESRYGVDIFINALVTVSELRTDGQELDPEGPAEYYVNSCNTLQALAALQDTESSPFRDGLERPDAIETPVASTTDEIDIAEPPLDGLFVAPIDEQAAEKSKYDGDLQHNYLARVNFKLASTVLSLLSVSGSDPGNVYNRLDHDFYTIDVANVTATVDAAKRLVESKDAIRTVESEKEALEEHLGALSALRDGIATLRAGEFEPGVIPGCIEDVSNAVAGRRDRFVKATSALDLTSASFDEVEQSMERITDELPTAAATPDEFDDAVDNKEIGDFEPAQFTPHRTIGRYVFLRLILARIEAQLADHEFERRIDELWEQNEDDLDDSLASLNESEPTRKYEEGIDPYLVDSAAEVEADLSETSWYERGKRKRLKRTLDRIERTREELQELFRAFDRLQTLRNRITTGELPPLQAELDAVTELLDSHHGTGTELVSQRRSQIRTLRNRRDTYRDRVAPTETFSGSIGDIPLQVDPNREISRQSLHEASTLFDLIDDGLLDRDQVLRQIKTAIRVLSEPMEDSFEETGIGSREYLHRIVIPMTAPGNSDVFSMDGDVQSNLDIIANNNDVEEMLDGCWIDDPFSITFVMLHGNVRLRNTSEFRVVKQRWHDGTLHRLLGSDIELPHHNAYPELIPSVPGPMEARVDDAAAIPVSDEVTGE
jgi:hypothetical protein